MYRKRTAANGRASRCPWRVQTMFEKRENDLHIVASSLQQSSSSQDNHLVRLVARVNYLPEPLDLLGIAGVVAVDRVALPIIDVDLLHAAQHQLQLPFVKVMKPLERNHFVETVQEGFRLLFDTAIHPPISHQPIEI